MIISDLKPSTAMLEQTPQFVPTGRVCMSEISWRIIHITLSQDKNRPACEGLTNVNSVGVCRGSKIAKMIVCRKQNKPTDKSVVSRRVLQSLAVLLQFSQIRNSELVIFPKSCCLEESENEYYQLETPICVLCPQLCVCFYFY